MVCWKWIAIALVWRLTLKYYHHSYDFPSTKAILDPMKTDDVMRTVKHFNYMRTVIRYKYATGYCKLSKETQENVRRKIEAFALPQNTRTFKYIVPGLFWDINISPHSWYAVVIPNHIYIKRVFNLDIDKHVLFTPLITFKFVIYTFKYVLYERSIIYIIYSSIEIMWVKYR